MSGKQAEKMKGKILVHRKLRMITKVFYKFKTKVGDRLWENNHHEEECYEEGLRSLYNNDEERVKAAVEGIKQAYDSSSNG